MPNWLQAYANWLHLGWPAGTVEPLPEIGPDGSTRLSGVYVAGDLTGVPLLKFALDSGARVVRSIAASLEPIFTYPAAMRPAGELQVSATVKEDLVAELERQAQMHGIRVRAARAVRIERRRGVPGAVLADGEWLPAWRVLIAIGRSGDHRRLGVPGELLGKVSNRLHDPADFAGRDVLVAGGRDAAAECALLLGDAGARVTLAHRGDELTRPKPELRERLEAMARAGRITMLRGATVREIRA